MPTSHTHTHTHLFDPSLYTHTHTHAGSGSILEALSLEKMLVVVVNENLMGNHQTELAEQMEALGVLLHTTPK